ncbi:MAG: Lrp/AsnC family transcriptional regulator [bacterium]
MVTAVILINAERSRIASAAQEILKLKGITEVYSVAGDYDLIAIARVRENEQLAKLVTEDLIVVEGITRTNTLIAFRQFSEYDLERMFSLGLE